MNSEIRVRFAPSPTGFLHVGGLRTALYDYLYARKTAGKFILRIEDTDRTRFIEGAAEKLIQTLKDVGLEFDEGPEKDGVVGPYYQSLRTEIYKKYIDELIEKDAAYYCFCSSDDLDKMREEQRAKGIDPKYDGRCRKLSKEERAKRLDEGKPFVVRLKVPQEGEITFYDIVREKVTFPWKMVDDQILIKSDGFPTYHLANVVDDHLMGITHVIRGEEWLSSVPKHLLLYEQFGWKPPKMAHLPLLLNPGKSKLSKRQGDVAVEDYLEKGYLPEALLNFIALLGWHPKGDRELFTLEELEKEFSMKRITKAGAVFDVEKLNWMNGHYIRSLDLIYIADKSQSFFEKTGIDITDKDKYLKVIANARMRVSKLSDIVGHSKQYYFDLKLSEEAKKIILDENSQKIYKYWIDEFYKKENWSKEDILELQNKSMEKLGIKGKSFFIPIRLALIGAEHGPDFPTIIDILGKDETIKRFSNVLNLK